MSTSTDKFTKMTTEPVERLVCKLAVPTIISMLVTTFYNLADTFFNEGVVAVFLDRNEVRNFNDFVNVTEFSSFGFAVL